MYAAVGRPILVRPIAVGPATGDGRRGSSSMGSCWWSCSDYVSQSRRSSSLRARGPVMLVPVLLAGPVQLGGPAYER